MKTKNLNLDELKVNSFIINSEKILGGTKATCDTKCPVKTVATGNLCEPVPTSAYY